MREPRIFHSFIREIFVDGSHPKLFANRLSNDSSTCLSASDICARATIPLISLFIAIFF
jgi:hypothetical protein